MQDDVDDVLSVEEELCLRLDTMRDFFLQQLKAIRDSLFSSQTKVQEDLKAFKESILTEDLNFYTERLEAHVKYDLQLQEENFNSAKTGVEEMVKAMGESVSKRMDTVERILDTLASRIAAMEVQVCGTVASSTFEASTSPHVQTTRRSYDLLSRAEALSSTQVSDVGQESETFLDLQSAASSSPIPSGQRAVLTTTGSVESSSYQNSEPAEDLSSIQVADGVSDIEISVDLQSLPLAQAGSSGLHKRKLVQSLEDLEPELAANLRPYTRLRHTQQEKLTGLQAAFFNLQMDRLNITGMFKFSIPLYAEAKCINIWVLTCLFEYLFLCYIQTPRASQTRQKS